MVAPHAQHGPSSGPVCRDRLERFEAGEIHRGLDIGRESPRRDLGIHGEICPQGEAAERRGKPKIREQRGIHAAGE